MPTFRSYLRSLLQLKGVGNSFKWSTKRRTSLRDFIPSGHKTSGAGRAQGGGARSRAFGPTPISRWRRIEATCRHFVFRKHGGRPRGEGGSGGALR